MNERITVTVTPGTNTYGKFWIGGVTTPWEMYDTNLAPESGFVLTLEPGNYIIFTSEGGANVWAKVSDFGGVPK